MVCSRVLCAFLFLVLLRPPVALCAEDESAEAGAQIVTQRWRFGLVLTAVGGSFRGITATVTVPMDWPEQRVREVEKDLSPGVKINYQPIEDQGRQMAVRIPHLAAGDEARAVVTFEVRRLARSAPDDAGQYQRANPKRLDRRLGAWLAPSPFIEIDSPEIREAAKALRREELPAWRQVKTIYDWVQQKIQFEDNQGQEILGAVDALRAGKGDCDEITSLFVALCRANGVPARTVRVPGHVYPEFYLLDGSGEGHWFPCQSAGTPAFGYMPDLRPILQRGDNVLMPDPRNKKKTRVRYFPENVVGLPAGSGGSIQRKAIAEMVKE